MSNIQGKNIITEVPVLDSETPISNSTKMYLNHELTFRQIPLSRLFDWIKGKMTLVIYPVGSIYLTLGSSNPATLFGGTWQKIEGGRFLICSSSTYTVNTTGGDSSVTLTTNNLPSHKHSVSLSSNGGHTHTPSSSSYLFSVNKNISGTGTDVERLKVQTGSSGRYTLTSQNLDSIYQYQNTSSAGSHSHTATVSNTGSGQSFKIIPPYLAVNMWKRVS